MYSFLCVLANPTPLEMSRIDLALTSARVFAFWFTAGMFTLGASIFASLLVAPQLLVGTYFGSFIQQAVEFASKSAPYVWFALSPTQLYILGLLVDVSGVLSLLTWPKTSGLVVFGLTFWRQIFLRTHMGDPRFPNSPICMYKSQTCPAMDIFHILTTICGVLIFTAQGPLPETTLSALKTYGFTSPWIDRTLGKLHRARSPRRHPVQAPRPSEESRKRQ
jgi:hypothetical protein